MFPTRNRGSLADDTLTNSFALCPKVQTYWLSIFNLIPRIHQVSFNPKVLTIIVAM